MAKPYRGTFIDNTTAAVLDRIGSHFDNLIAQEDPANVCLDRMGSHFDNMGTPDVLVNNPAVVSLPSATVLADQRKICLGALAATDPDAASAMGRLLASRRKSKKGGRPPKSKQEAAMAEIKHTILAQLLDGAEIVACMISSDVASSEIAVNIRLKMGA